MEVIKHSIKHGRRDIFTLYFLGDIHAGSIHCAEDDIKDKVAEIERNKNAFWVGMGDYADCITKDDKRFDIVGLAPWVERDNIVESQRQWLRNLFLPIKDKCLCLLTGNHEEDIHSHHQNDITRNLCNDLNVQYAGFHCFLIIEFYRGVEKNGNLSDKWVLTWHLWHGAGTAQTEGARIMRLMRLVNDVVADGYAMGHLHAKAFYEVERLRCERLRVKSQTVKAFITGSWLKTYNQPDKGQSLSPSYGEKRGYKPSCISTPTVIIHPEQRTYTVEF